MPQIFYVIANENTRYKYNKLELKIEFNINQSSLLKRESYVCLSPFNEFLWSQVLQG